VETTDIRVGINFSSAEEAEAFAAEVRQKGGTAEASEEPGLLPLGILLWVVVPPGLGLLAFVANKIAHSWLDHGTLIDARGQGAPQVVEQGGLPYGTVVILTRDGDKSERSDLPDDASVSTYIEKALTALSSGDSASSADEKASDAAAQPNPAPAPEKG
jgi:hypothetical protein